MKPVAGLSKAALSIKVAHFSELKSIILMRTFSLYRESLSKDEANTEEIKAKRWGREE